MKRKPIILATVALSCLTTSAQINSPESAGYESRAAAMLADGNFQGCIDQCKVASQLGSTRPELVAWLSAAAAFNGGMSDAAKLVNAYIKKFPAGSHMASARLMQASLTFYGGNYAAALKQLTALNPAAYNDNEREDLLYRTAYCYLQLGDYYKADDIFQTLSDTQRYGAPAKFYLAYIAYVEGDYDRAMQLFATCDKTASPGNMSDFYVAQILFKRKNYGEVLNLLMPLMTRKDVEKQYVEECQRLAGECFYALHDDNRAMVYLNPYIADHKDDAPLSTRYIVGVERYQTGDYEEALDLLAPVSNLTDEMGQSAALTMGQCYQSLGNYKSAAISFEKAINLDFNPRLTEMAYYNYVVSQVDGGRLPFGNYVQDLENFLTRYPDSRYANSVREYLVKGYMATDDYEGALRSLNSMSADSPAINAARQRVNFVLGTRALQAGDAQKAVGFLTEAMKYGNCDSDIEKQTSLWLGDAYYALGDYAKASVEYKSYMASSTDSDTNRLLAKYNLGYADFAERNYAEAKTMFEKVAADKRASSVIAQDALNRVGDIHYYNKEFDEAKSAYTKALNVNKQTGDYSLLNVAMMQGHSGDYKSKIATLQKFLSDYPQSNLKPVAQTEMALTLGLQGNNEAAIALYKQLAATHSGTKFGRNALLQLAILSDNAGNTASAKTYYRNVVSEYPTSAEAVLAVQDLKRIYGDEGAIMELDRFLSGIKDAPQLDATERNAIAAASLLQQAEKASTAESRLQLAEKLLTEYPDAAETEKALEIAAQAYVDMGVPGKALEKYTSLDTKASTESIRQTALMGILRTASDLKNDSRVVDAANRLLANQSMSGTDLPEVKFRRAVSLARLGNQAEANDIFTDLAKDPTTLFGTRAAFELANAYFTDGELDRAHDVAESLIDANPPYAYWLARTFILYSDILRAQGSDFEADEYLRVLRSNYPGTENDIFQMIDKRLPQ